MRSRRTRSLRTCGFCLGVDVRSYGQIADSAPDAVADIPVNYTEAKVGTYALPDPLKLNNGQPVQSTRLDEKRRPEIRKLIEENWFGRAPGVPKSMLSRSSKRAPRHSTERHPPAGHDLLHKERTGPKMDLLIYLPANAKGPSPMFLNMSSRRTTWLLPTRMSRSAGDGIGEHEHR